MSDFNKITQTRFGLMIYNQYDRYIGRSLEHYGEFSYGEAAIFDQLLREGMTVVEIGANIGAHTIMLAQKVTTTGLVIAFEPQRIVYQTLCGNLALNSLVNVEAHQIAIGDRIGTIGVPKLDYSALNNFGGVSLNGNGAGEEVSLRTLDSFNLSRCDFLKLDIEGMEEAALRGALATIEKHRPMIYLENDREEKSESLGSLLDSLGYDMFWHHPAFFNKENFKHESKNIFGNIVSKNLMCVPRERNAQITGLKEFQPTGTSSNNGGSKNARTQPLVNKRKTNTSNPLSQGIAYFTRQEYQLARTELEKALTTDGKNVECLSHLALTLSMLKDTDRACALLLRAIDQAPFDPVIRSNLGNIKYQTGSFQEALVLYDHAIALNPEFTEAWSNRGSVLSKLDRQEEALESLGRALQIDPQFIDALNNKALVLISLDQSEQALDTYEKIIQSDPGNVAARCSHAKLLLTLDRSAQAIDSINIAIDQLPKKAALHKTLASILRSTGQTTKALKAYEKAIELDPDDYLAMSHQASVLGELGRTEDYLAACNKVLELNPDFVSGYNDRGVALYQLDRVEEAVESYSTAVELQPDFTLAYINLGNSLGKLERLDEAIACYDQALVFQPESPEILFCKALVLLMAGRFDEGLPLYEHRWEGAGKSAGMVRRKLSRPLWSGKEDLTGKTIFVHFEQGLGDTLQFCRYLGRLHELGATVVFQPHPPLVQLLKESGIKAKLVDNSREIPEFDYHCPLMSLPMAFSTTLSTIPNDTPYLGVSQKRVAKWRSRINPKTFNIGINWQGAKSKVDLGRSFPVALFEPVSKLADINLYSLQRFDGEEQLESLPMGMRVERFGDSFDSEGAFLDTAGVMKNLELVITSDTSIAHLAGGLGCPVWLILKKGAEWRWMLNRDTSPWYPSMRLFRQTSSGDWESVFAAVEEALKNELNTWKTQEKEH